MTEIFDPYHHFARLDLPVQDLTKLTFCGGGKSVHVQDWANQLQATRVTHTSVQLYKNLPEISRLKTDPKTRLDMLEALRPSVQNAINGLAQQFLGQPLILPEEARKTAIVAQALQKSMANGYNICVRDLLNQKNLNKQGRDNLTTAIYRATFSISALYLRTCQIYTHLPPGWWLQLHQLYRTAEHFELSNESVADPLLKLRKTASAREAYLRTVMLACSQTNQLSQQHMGLAFDAFESWASLVRLSADVNLDNDNPFVINLSRGEAPTYKERFNGEEQDYLLEPDFSSLLHALSRLKESSGKQGDVVVPKGMPDTLIQHLANTWHTTADRQQQRHKIRTTVDVCVGLTECHYHLAGARSFSVFLDQAGGVKDWHEMSRYTSPGGFISSRYKAGPADTAGFSPTRVSVQNISSGGYCLYWENDIPSHATAGQLLGIRDAGSKTWHLGVIRWVRQLRGASQMGVQILAQDAYPAAAALMYDMGGYSDPMRVFVVPAGQAAEATPTLITPGAPFQTSSRLRLICGKKAAIVTLDHSIFTTGKVRQFPYQLIAAEEQAPVARPTPVVDDIDATGTIDYADSADNTGNIGSIEDADFFSRFDSDWD